MSDNIGKIWFASGLDNAGMRKDANETKTILRRIGDSAEAEGARIDSIWSGLAKRAVFFAGGLSMGTLFTDIVKVRGEFQQLDIAFSTMLRSESRASLLMDQLIDTAAKTPFDLQGVANGAKQLLAYGTAAEDVNGELIRLGDIAAGLSIPLGDLVYLYGTTQVQGRLFTQDVRQFQGRGIPLIQELAKELGKSTEEINKMVTAGKIGFPEVQKVIHNLTNEGGMFHNLMKKQSASLTGQISNLEDAWDVMLNNLGKKSEGAFNSAIETATYLVENYEDVLNILGSLVATYGTYKTIVIATATLKKASERNAYATESQELAKLMTAEQKRALEIKNINLLTNEQRIAVRAKIQADFDALKVDAMLQQQAFITAQEEHKLALQRALSSKAMVSQREVELSLAKLSGNSAKIELANKALLEAQEQRHIAVKERKATADTLAIANSKKNAAATAVDTIQTQVNAAATTAASKSKGILSLSIQGVIKAFHGMKAAFASNPIGMIATVIISAASAFALFSRKTEEADKQIAEFSLKLRQEESSYKSLVEATKKSADGSKERAEVIRLINQRYKDYLPSLLTEKDSLDKIVTSLSSANEQMSENIKLKLKETQIERIRQGQLETETEFATKLTNKYSQKGNRSAEEIALFTTKITELVEKARTGAATVDDARQLLIAMGEDAGQVNKAIISSDSHWARMIRTVTGGFYDIKKAAEQAGTAENIVDALIGEITKNPAKPLTDKEIKAIQDLGRKKMAAQLAVQESRIDAMKEGRVKELAELKLRHDQELAAIEKEKQDLEKAYKEVGTAMSQADIDGFNERIKNADLTLDLGTTNINEKYSKEIAGIYHDLADVFLKEEERKQVGIKKTYDDLREWAKKALEGGSIDSAQYADISIKIDQAEVQESLNDILEDYRTFEQKRADMAEEYNSRIQRMEAQNTNGQYDKQIKEAKRQRDSVLAEMDSLFEGTTTLWAKLFDNFALYTKKELQEIIDNARAVLDYVNSTPDAQIVAKFGMSAEQLRSLKGNAAELGSAYEALSDKIEKMNRNPFAVMIKSAKDIKKVNQDILDAKEKLTEAEKTGNKETIKNAKTSLDALNRQKQLLKGDLKTASLSAASYLGEIGDSLQQIGEAAGDADLASFGAILSDVSGVAEKFMQGDIIGGVLSGLTSIFSAIFGSRAKYRAALKQMREDLDAFHHEYALAMSDIRLKAEDASNAFNDDAFRKAIISLNEMIERYQDYLNLVNKDDGIQNSRKGPFGRFNQLKQEAKGITTDLQNIWVQTRNATWFRKAKGFYIKDMYPELFEGEDGFNVEAARALLATNNQLNDEAKRQLQNVIDMYDQWQEAEDQFKEYLNTTFGEIGGGLGDAIVDAFKNGTDAMQTWAKSFSNVLENLGKQLMYTLYFQKYFDKLETDLTKIYQDYGNNPTQLGQRVQDLLGSFFTSMNGQTQLAEEWYKMYAENAKKYGFDLAASDSSNTQSATAKGFATASQDSVEELNGRTTAIQMTLIEMKGLSLISIDYLAKIEKHTSVLPVMANNITQIKKNTDRL